MGDSSPAADKLMRSQGVRALPSFHFVRAIPAQIELPLRSRMMPRLLRAAKPKPLRRRRLSNLPRVAAGGIPTNPRAATCACLQMQWKNKEQIESISGAKTQALQDAIEANM